MKTITYRYYRQEFNYLQERVDQAAACGTAISKAADLASNFCYTGYMLEY